jgi:hypothetical protein
MNGLLMQTVHTAARCYAPAAAFGKIAFANFASASNREEYHESDNTIFTE